MKPSGPNSQIPTCMPQKAFGPGHGGSGFHQESLGWSAASLPVDPAWIPNLWHSMAALRSAGSASKERWLADSQLAMSKLLQKHSDIFCTVSVWILQCDIPAMSHLHWDRLRQEIICPHPLLGSELGMPNSDPYPELFETYTGKDYWIWLWGVHRSSNLHWEYHHIVLAKSSKAWSSSWHETCCEAQKTVPNSLLSTF